MFKARSRKGQGKVLGVVSSPKELQWCFKKVLSVFEVSRVFQKSFMDVSTNIEGRFQ